MTGYDAEMETRLRVRRFGLERGWRSPSARKSGHLPFVSAAYFLNPLKYFPETLVKCLPNEENTQNLYLNNVQQMSRSHLEVKFLKIIFGVRFIFPKSFETFHKSSY